MQIEVWRQVKEGDVLESSKGTFKVRAVRLRVQKPSVLTIENAAGVQYDTADHELYELGTPKKRLRVVTRLKMCVAAAVRVWQETGR